MVERRRESAAREPGPAQPYAAQPLVVHLERDPAPQGFVEIVEAGSGRRVITVIEFPSPTNQVPGEGQQLYLRKRGEPGPSRRHSSTTRPVRTD